MGRESGDNSFLVATSLRSPDIGYAYLYSPAGEFKIYFTPAAILLSALVGWLSLRSGATADTTLKLMGDTLIIGWWVKWAVSMAILLFPAFQFWNLAGGWLGSNVTHHLFTDAGIEITAPNQTSLLPWSAISRAIETQKGFLFYRNGKIATFVPERHLEGAAEISIIRKFIRQNVVDATLLG
jgi:hypothetical protein